MDPISGVAGTILQYGPLGVFVLLFLIGWIVPKPYIDRLEKENEELKHALAQEREISREATFQLSTANQFIGSLRQIAVERAKDSGVSLPASEESHGHE